MTNDINAIKEALQRAEAVSVEETGKISTQPSSLGVRARALHWFNWWESPRGAQRLVEDNREVKARFKSFRLVPFEGGYAWHGTLRSNLGYDYEILARYPANHPDSPARVIPLIDGIKRVHNIHLYQSGEICFAPPDDRTYARMKVADLLALTAIWIANYEQICLGGVWMGPQAGGGR